MKDSIAVAHFFCFGLNAPVIMVRGGEADGCQISSSPPPSPCRRGGGGAGGWRSALWGENNLGIGLGTVAASLHGHRGLSHLLRCHIRSGTQTAHMRANTWRNRTSPPGYWRDLKPAEQSASPGSSRAQRNASN